MSVGATGGPRPARRWDLWSLREDVHVEVDAESGAVTLRGRWGDATLPPLGRGALEALRRMSFGPVCLDHVSYEDGERRRLDELLDELQPLVIRSVAVDPERPLLSIVPVAPQARLVPAELDPERPIRLSRFAMLRVGGAGYVLESSLSLHRVELHRAEAVQLIGVLGRPVAPRAAAAALPYAEPLVLDLLALLAGAGMVVAAERQGDPRAAVFAEDTAPDLATWSPLGLMFHSRSTLGRHDEDFGAVYPMGREWDVEPVVKRAPEVPGIALPRPRWGELVAADPPLVVAVEGGGPAAAFGDAPVTACEVGQLLYRAARVRALAPAEAEWPATADTSDRPHLNIGGCYEFELYLTLHNCAGLPRGIYHYDPLGHRLEPVSQAAADVDALLENSRLAANLATAPPVLISVTARFRRLSRKYNGLSYALALKNTGALLQTLHLVSTAMGLASTWTEIVDIGVSSRVLGLDWRAESGVAEFLLGRPAEGAPDGAAKEPAEPHNDPRWASWARARLSRRYRS